MSPAAGAPAGFVASRPGPGALLVADPACLESLRAAGLDQPERWQRLLDEATGSSGRGRTAVLRLADGALRLKQLRRGGWVGRLWHDRFCGTGRLLDNLRVAHEARRRGVPTPQVVALIAVEGPRGLHRAWLAAEEIDGADDLASRVRRAQPLSRAEWAVVMAAVRGMHDRGVEHRDLNLGNLLLGGEHAAPAAFVIDLDRARLWPGALPLAIRRRALLRLERSWVKQRGAADEDPARDWIYETYAGGDPALAQHLARGRRSGRWWIRLHRMG